MNMRYEIRKEADHTRIDVAGEYEAGAATRILEAGIEAALAQGNRRLLVDARQLTGNPRTMQRFELGESLARYYHEKRGKDFIRLAIVGNVPLIDPERFGEIVANNRGLPIKVTTDIEEALRFLELADPR
jgi:hypothetical protein